MLAAEVCSSPLCHRPKSRSHRRSTGVPNRSAPCPLRPTQTPAERPSSEASRQLSCACAKHGPMQYGSTRCWCVLRRDCFASGRQLTTQPSAVTAQMRRVRASDCACGRSCISSIPIISSPSADTLSHKQRLNRACAHFLRSWALPRCAKRGWPTAPKTFPPFRSDTAHRRAVRKGTVGSAASLSRRVGMVTGAHC